MDNVKDDRYFLEKIVADLGFVIENTEGITKESLTENRLLQDSIMFRLIQIAENNAKLSDSFKARHNEISWTAIKGMRNRIVHDYGAVDMDIVLDTVLNYIPRLHARLTELLQELQ